VTGRRIAKQCPCSEDTDIFLPEFAGVASAACRRCGRLNYVSRYVRIDIGLTEVCNLTCIMCRRPQEKEAMPVEKVLRTLEEAAEIGVRVISFSGGEPFAHPGFRRILRHATTLPLEVELVTNATLVRESDIPMLERLRCVTVSIDGPRAQHDFIRGRAGAWGSTMRAVELLAGSSAQWGTNTVMQRDNADVLYETWRRIRERGRPSYVGFTHVEVVPETSHLQLTLAQAESARDQLRRVREECARESVFFNDAQLTGPLFHVFADKTRRFRPLHGCPVPQEFVGVSSYGYFPCWHQGRYVQANGLIEALQTELCSDIIREAAERRCIGCNAANYSWNDGWLKGVVAAHAAGEFEAGVVYLSGDERRANRLREGRRTLPLLERRGVRS
jgi:MoaA/NifB/PqqE/SkfB family radical SAM enzyme